MITIEEIVAFKKEEITGKSATINENDIALLIDLLNEKDDSLRYHAFLLLQNRSQLNASVYPYWDVFVKKFTSTNSYQRSLGLMLIAENVKWDNENKFDAILDAYLLFFEDEKPVTVRQSIQNLCKIVPYKQHLIGRIQEKLLAIDISLRKDTQQKILLIDILSVLAVMRRYQRNDQAENYILTAMTGEKLDKKAKLEVQKLLIG